MSPDTSLPARRTEDANDSSVVNIMWVLLSWLFVNKIMQNSKYIGLCVVYQYCVSSPTIQVLRSADALMWPRLASLLKMELSESVMKGLQTLAEPNVFNLKSFTIFTEAAFDSLVSSRGESVLGKMVELFFFVLHYFRCFPDKKEVALRCVCCWCYFLRLHILYIT